MTTRRWDVARRAVLAVAVIAGTGACGQARADMPPEPEFVSGTRAAATVVTAPALATPDEVRPEDVEADAGPVDVSRMVVTDDAGNVAPNLDGWATFDDLVSRRLSGDLSASVAVMVDGVIVHQAAFGQRVRGADEVEVTDRYRIGSISKTISAIVAMDLVEDGALQLDEPVGNVLVAHLGVSDPDTDAAGLTLRELLSHTSGLGAFDGAFFSNGAESCNDAAADALRSVGSGSGYRYSNMNYCLVGVLIEATTGKTYERVVQERVLTPLGITGMRMPATYDLGPDEADHEPRPGRNYMEVLAAAGGWNATPADLVTILNSIDPDTPGWKVLSPELAESMRYRVVTGGSPAGYGLGLINYPGGFGHTGTIEHAHAMVMVQDDGVTWAVTVSGEVPSSTGNLRGVVQSALSSAFGA